MKIRSNHILKVHKPKSNVHAIVFLQKEGLDISVYHSREVFD